MHRDGISLPFLGGAEGKHDENFSTEAFHTRSPDHSAQRAWSTAVQAASAASCSAFVNEEGSVGALRVPPPRVRDSSRTSATSTTRHTIKRVRALDPEQVSAFIAKVVEQASEHPVLQEEARQAPQKKQEQFSIRPSLSRLSALRALFL